MNQQCKIRAFVYAYTLGAMTLAILTIHLQPPPTKITLQEKIDTLALVLDGGELIDPNYVEYVPIPKRKPEQGYTVAYIQDMNDFIAGFVR